MKNLKIKLLSWISVGLLGVAILVSILCFSQPAAVNAAWDGSTASSFASGSGTESDPYLIKTASQMGYFMKQYASGVTYRGIHIRLENSLDMTGATWNYNHEYNFEGTFNGNGYTITADCPLFYGIGMTGTLKGLNYTTIQTQLDRPLLCVINKGTIDSCVCYGDVYLKTVYYQELGFLCMTNSGTVTNCGAIGSLKVVGDDASCKAAMICSNSGTISDCFSALRVTASASGKYSTSSKDPLVLGTSTGCYYDSDLYPGTAQTGVGLTTEQLQSSAFLSSYLGTSITGTNWVTGSHGYPELAHCSDNYAFVEGYRDVKSVVCHASQTTFTLKSNKSYGYIYYTLDGTDPTSSDTRKLTSYGHPVTVTGDAVLTMVPYVSGSYGSISRLDITALPGKGTENAPYEISTKKQLKTLSMFPDACFKLMNDICFTETDFAYGGIMSGGWIPVEDFRGTLNGNECAIQGLQGKNGGLVITNRGTITSLRLTDHKLYAYDNYGAIATDNSGTITRCYVRSAFTLNDLPPKAIKGAEQVGGIAASNSGTISYCRNDGLTVFTGGRKYCIMNYIGGICGYNSNVLTNCINTGTVVLMSYEHTDNGYVGGIVGRGSATNSYSDTDFVIYQSFDYNVKVGGISGTDSYWGIGAQSCISTTPEVVVGVSGPYLPPTVNKYPIAASHRYCYLAEDVRLPSDCPDLDFISNWMLSDEGLIPKGVADENGHCFTDMQRTVYPTCTETGSARVRCTICGLQLDQTIPALGHVEVVDEAVVPTCTEDGLTEGCHCSACDGVLTEQTVIPATGHSEVVDEAVAPTCTEDGLTEGEHCSVCGKVFVAQEVVKALSHNEAIRIGHAATCTESGLTDGKYCIRCDEILTEQKEIPASGHSYGQWTTQKNATCLESGLEQRNCLDCDHFETRDIEATGHSYEAVITAPSCTEQGYTTNTCANCGDHYVDAYVEAQGHKFGVWTVTVAATCTEKGMERRECKNCDHYETRQTEAVGHSYKSTVVPATCTEQGYVSYVCANCDSSYADSYVDAKGHKYGVWTVTVAATCTEKGMERRECKNCDHYETRQTEAVGHSYQAVVTAPACLEQGYTTYTCVNCADSYKDNYTDALGHKWDAGTVTVEPGEYETGKRLHKCTRCDATEEREIPALGHTHDYKAVVTAPTCTEDGYTTHTCRCGDSYEDSIVKATGHQLGDWTVTKAATCTAKGAERRDCANCDHFETRDIEATGHSYEAVVTAPTCTENGYTTHTCRCGDSFVDSYTEALGHNWDEGTVLQKPTEYENGKRLHKCTRCDATEEREIPALGHTHAYQETVVEPTCTEEGYTEYTCVCGDSYIDDYVDIVDHKFGGWTVDKAATCIENGTERRDCATCDLFETREVAATGHSYQETVTAPTCTEQGYTTHTCANCGESHVDGYTNALGHSWDAGAVLQEPTEYESGTQLYQCGRCGAEEERVLPALGHTHRYEETVTVPTCTEQGYTTHSCVCGDSYVDSYVQASGHDYVSAITAPTCDTSGYTTYTCRVCGESYTDSHVEALGHSYVDGVCSICGSKDLTFVQQGDCNGDGVIDNVDAMLALQYYVGLIDDTQITLEACDVNGDEVVDNVDAMMILQYYVGLIQSFK